MNAKKNKNKKANKQPNPTPPQKEETEIILEKIESEISDQVDIISDVVAEPDTPKKPKRNRGKKKKQDRDDDKIEEKTPEPVKIVDDSMTTDALNSEIDIMETEAKPLSQSIDLMCSPIEETIKIATDTLVIQNTQKNEPPEQDTKQSKKKNKKKKRHDSDRSDKSGDAFSCTAAFQKLLDVSDEKPTDATPDMENLDEESKLTEVNILTVTDNVISTDITEILVPEVDEFKVLQKHESKRKKNKKDKKQAPKIEDFNSPIIDESSKVPREESEIKSLTEITQDQTQIANIQDIEKEDKTEMATTESKGPDIEIISLERIPQDLVMPSHIDEITEKDNKELVPQDNPDLEICNLDEESPKPKAKIAKPVDKKRKGKQESTDIIISSDFCTATSDSVPLQKSSAIKHMPEVQDMQKGSILDAPELSVPLEPVPLFVSDIGTTSVPKEEINSHTIPIEEILVLTETPQCTIAQEIKEVLSTPNMEEQNRHITPTDNKSGKKKRKPLKMPIPVPNISEPVKFLEEMTTDIAKEGKDEIGDVESIFETLVPADIEVKTTDEKLDEILESKVDPIDNNDSVSPATIEQTEEKWTKPKRRGKKSLKMPPTPGVKEEQFNLDTDTKNVEHEVTAQLSPIETLEIRSVKADDSECSPCDVTPDIVYPRSTSQLNIDNNNNTVIREISMSDTLNLLVGLTTPLIQGSGETPIGTPIMVSSLNIIELESSTEKKDLKSKVMEVSQDMEDLRLSLERSLAEFTAMEKSEEEAEKKYEERHTESIPVTSSDREISIEEDKQLPTKESIDIQIKPEYIPPVIKELLKETERTAPLATQEDDKDLEILKDPTEGQPNKDEVETLPEKTQCAETPPICPARRENKGKGKKRKGRQEIHQTTATQSVTESSKDKKEEKTEQKSETKEQDKQNTKQKDEDVMPSNEDIKSSDTITDKDYDPIENFEDALSTSVDDVDVNKTFEMILSEVTDSNQKELASNKPDINIISPEEDFRKGKVPQPKNLLGHPNIPVSSNKDDFKKEKHKHLNTKQAKVKIKDSNDIESKKDSKQSQTESRKKSKDFSLKKSNENGDFIYKYSFRKVFLQNTCHVCAKELLSLRVPCNFCNLLFYCSIKHKDEDWPQHQALCFAISTIVHLKDQKHIYAEAKNITGQNYRLLRMQMILSCEKVLKRRLVPWEQEALLYPRICADVRCREWRQSRLKDCEVCGQISYCANNLDHLPLTHQRWCKSYALYQKLVMHQQTKGRLEPKLPTKVMTGNYEIPEKINEILASMYEEEIDMNDIQYAALTQIATAPLTVAYSHQLYRKVTKPSTNGMFKKTSFVVHVLGAELQFEADVLNKWEVFFLHLRPDVNELVVVLISNNLNPGNLPLELLGKIRLCENCQHHKRRVIFSFQDKKSYQEYRTCDDFIYPDIVCTFNPSINRCSYNPKDQWPGIITTVMRLRSPFLITSHTPTELHRDLIRVKECGDVKVMVEPQRNSFASVRPDRNFITDDEAPLLFKNQCFAVLCGV